MKMEKRILFGSLVMAFFLLAGVVGNVSAAVIDQTDQLRLEVGLLEQINQMNLTNAQIDKILPILKTVQGIMQTADADLEKVLVKEKALLLQRKTQEAEALQVEKKVIREKADLQVKTALIDLQTILTPDQMKMLQGRLGLARTQQQALDIHRSLGKKDQAYLHGTGNGVIKMETPKGVVVVQQKANAQGKDVKVENTVFVKLSVETAKMILQNQEERLKELEIQIAKANDREKDVLQKHIDQRKEYIANLKKQIEKSTDGTVVLQPGMMGKGQLMMQLPGQTKIEMRGMVKKAMNRQEISSKATPNRMGKGAVLRQKQGQSDLRKAEVLSTLIKVLQELRSAK